MQLMDCSTVIVTELYNGGSIDSHLKDMQALLQSDPQKALTMLSTSFLDLASGLKAMHDLGAIHRDIKPGNILVNVDPSGTIEEAALSDYGLTISTKEAATSHPLTTPLFASPELQRYGNYEILLNKFLESQIQISENPSINDTSHPFGRLRSNQSDDIWALGLTFAMLLLGESHQSINSTIRAATNASIWSSLDSAARRKLFDELFPPPIEVEGNGSPVELAKIEMHKLCRNMLSLVKAERYNADQVLAKCREIHAIIHPQSP